MVAVTEPVEKLVPHSGKMSLLSRVKEVDFENYALRAEVDITPNSFFYDPAMNGIPVWIGFEYMAQSIAALSGKYDLEHGGEPKIGFILSVKNFKAKTNCFLKETTVSIFVKESLRLNPVVSFECVISNKDSAGSNEGMNDSILATATMTTIKVDNIEDFKNKEFE